MRMSWLVCKDSRKKRAAERHTSWFRVVDFNRDCDFRVPNVIKKIQQTCHAMYTSILLVALPQARFEETQDGDLRKRVTTSV